MEALYQLSYSPEGHPNVTDPATASQRRERAQADGPGSLPSRQSTRGTSVYRRSIS